MKTTHDYGGRSWQCPECKAWIPCPHGRLALETHIRAMHPALYEKRRAVVAEMRGEPA